MLSLLQLRQRQLVSRSERLGRTRLQSERRRRRCQRRRRRRQRRLSFASRAGIRTSAPTFSRPSVTSQAWRTDFLRTLRQSGARSTHRRIRSSPCRRGSPGRPRDSGIWWLVVGCIGGWFSVFCGSTSTSTSTSLSAHPELERRRWSTPAFENSLRQNFFLTLLLGFS